MPYLDGTPQSLGRVNALTAVLAVAGLIAAVIGRVRRVTPMLHLDLWRVELVHGSNDTRWYTSDSCGWVVLAAVLAVLAYGLVTGLVWPSLSSGVALALTFVLVAIAVILTIAWFALTIQKAGGRITLAYVVITTVWVNTAPLLFWLARPWNLVLVLLFLVPTSICLTIFCTRWHASMRLAGVEPNDVRLSIGETRFPRHMSRWILAAVHASVMYTTTFALLDTGHGSNFETVFIGTLIAQTVFALLVLLWTLACSGACCNSNSSARAESVESSARAQQMSANGGMVDARKLVASESATASTASDADDSYDLFRLGNTGRRRK